MGAATRVPVTVCPLTGADGEIAYLFRATNAKYSCGAAVGEMLKFQVSGTGTGPLVRATVMQTGEETATGAGTARELGAITATQRLTAHLHVLSASGTDPTLDVIVTSDDAEGMVDPTTRVTFTQATDVTSEQKTLDGPVTDTWWQVSWTIGGTNTPTFEFIVAFGIA